MSALDPALVARFRGDVAAIAGSPSPDDRLGVAVSGGGDSLALLLLAEAAYPGQIRAATVDHGLRPESADEATYVAAICAARGIPHTTLTARPGWHDAGNLQDQARRLRYRLLGSWGVEQNLAWIATGHQRDDVAEGLLMRARRGAGLAGLAAMPTMREGGGTPVIRPLLTWSRVELATLVHAAGIDAVADPSNENTDFDRVWTRQLLAISDLPADRLALAAANLRDAETALAWVADREWSARAEFALDGSVSLNTTDLPYDLRRRLVRRALTHVLAAASSASKDRLDGIDRLVAALDAGGHATLAGVAARSGLNWRFRLAPPRRTPRSSQS